MTRLEELNIRHIVGKCMPNEHQEKVKALNLAYAADSVDAESAELINETAALHVSIMQKLELLFDKYPKLSKEEGVERAILLAEGRPASEESVERDYYFGGIRMEGKLD